MYYSCRIRLSTNPRSFTDGISQRCERRLRFPVFPLAALSLLVGCGSEPVVAPTSFTNYNAKEGTFACEYPESWEAKGGGKRGPVWASFSSGPALIHIRASSAGSLMSDAMGGRSADAGAPAPQYAPVHKVHVDGIKMAEEQFNSYTELPGSPTVIECELGPARLSEFTAATTFGSAVHGYRATIIGHDKGVNVLCTCPESDWLALKPAFDHTLATLERGTPQ